MRLAAVNYNSNSRYFVKRSEIIRILSIIVIAVGAVLMALEIIIQFDTWAVMSAGVMLTAAGAAMYVFDSGRRMKDTEFDEVIRQAISAMPSKIESRMAEDRIRVKETNRYEFMTYDLDADGVLIKKGSDGALRSSRVSYTAVICGMTDKHPCVGVYKNSFSVTEPYEADSIYMLYEDQLKDTELDISEIEAADICGKKITAEKARVRITFDEDSAIDFPVKNDASVDEFISMMKRICQKNRK